MAYVLILRHSFVVGLFFLTTNYAHGVELSGHYTNLLFQHKNSLNQSVITDLNRFRLTADGGENAWQWRLSYDHDILYGGAVRDPAFTSIRQIPDPTLLDLSASIATSPTLDWRHNIYRGWLQYNKNAWNIIVGRQRIAWGSGRIWNPTDRFNPIQVTALELDQKLGVDAAYVTYRYADFSSVQLFVAPGQVKRDVSRKWALRWQDTMAQTDIALWLGEIGQERVLAVDVTGNVGDATARLEWQQSWHGKQGSFGQFVIGIDGTWANPLFAEGLYLAAEYFYNGLPDANSGAFRQLHMLQSRSQQLFGLLAGYDVTPLWRTELTELFDLEKSSVFVVPRVRWSASDNMDVVIFAQLPTGLGTGEFASLNDLFAIKLEYYF